MTDRDRTKAHWERVYETKASSEMSWFQAEPHRSLALIDHAAPSRDDFILDVGGGDSTLVDHLMSRGYRNISVLDISHAALDRAKARLGQSGRGVRWVEASVLTADLEDESVDVWHDRAVFHFLTRPVDQEAYIRQVARIVRPGGSVIVATFAENGPTRCSGLPVARYSARALHSTFGVTFRLVESVGELHVTPSGARQHFTYCSCRYEPEAALVPG
ncbi:MAG: class I SAM-dependent methyltransferase [Gemmatimonadaceae bacterium]